MSSLRKKFGRLGGFTLVEVLVVITIIGLLAAIERLRWRQARQDHFPDHRVRNPLAGPPN